MSTSFTKYPPHKLTVGDDGSFVVKSGDCLSKYTWAIKGSWGNESDWHQFRRPGPNGPIKITNVNVIDAGETLIYMPLYKPGTGNPGNGGGGNGQKNPPDPGQGGGNGKHAFSFPMLNKETNIKTKGKFIYQFIVSAEGEVAVEGITVRAGDPGTFGNKVANEIGQGWMEATDTSVTLDDLAGVAKNFLTGTREEFNQALGDLVSYEVRKSYEFPNVNIQVTGRLESSETPVVLTANFFRQSSFEFQGSKVDYQGRFRITVKVGLSKEGWKAVLRKLNIVLAVGATLSTVALLNWLVDNAQDKGDKTAYATWYARTYVTAVFEREVFRLPSQQSHLHGAREMVEVAMRDVIRDMRDIGIEVPVSQVPPYDQIPSDFWKPAKNALKTYEQIVIAQSGTDAYTAQDRLLREAKARAEQKLGV
ncbi:hypothetical protein F183_A03870 [Bryobacterales bacterium F-183]|nr:hypothetical protein F183_A03870 [Bryobacterales bacterium F-183]